MYDSSKQDQSSYIQQRKAEKGELYNSICEILFNHDPVGINLEVNIDEYEPEADTIVPRLEEAKSLDDVTGIVPEEFFRWFGDDSMVNDFMSEEAVIRASSDIFNLLNRKGVQ